MSRLSLWMRAHPMVGDSIVALFLALLELPMVLDPVWTPWSWGYLGTGLLLVGPLVLRRTRPLPASYLVLSGGLLYVVMQGSHPYNLLRIGELALGICLYTMIVYAGRRQALWYALGLTAGTTLWALWRVGIGPELTLVILAVLAFAFCWVLGEFVGARRAYLSEVEQRLRLLETERDQQTRIAVAEERTRIARELHDVVAHSVSVIVVQADGAAYAVRADPELAERAVRTISATGREALNELRRLLGVLRSDHDEENGRVPQPNVVSLNELTERVRTVGLPVRLDLSGELDDLPAGVGLGVYRIVQESLTNTLKHAGPGASAEVRIMREGDRIELEITDDGRGGKFKPTKLSELGTVGGGNGLIGMRERATVFGGTLEAGRNPAGGWRVHAVLPVGNTLVP